MPKTRRNAAGFFEKKNMLKKNEEYRIRIEDYGNDGEGIGHVDGIAVFVKDVVKGDLAKVRIVKAKKNYAYGIPLEIISPSPDRVTPPCPHARVCGGCSLMHISYDSQLAWKQQKVRACLERIGGVENAADLMEPIVRLRGDAGEGDGLRYRNKGQFPVGKGRDGELLMGFYGRHSHRIVNTEGCLLQSAKMDLVLHRCREFLEESSLEPYDEENHSGLIRHIVIREARATGELQVCPVICADSLPGDADERLVDVLKDIDGITSIVLNINKERTNRILGARTRLLWGREWIEDRIKDLSFEIGPVSFYQVNPVQTERMYEKILSYAHLTGSETVFDLYCGIGTISLFLARSAKYVYGIEIVPEAIEDAKRNAVRNGITNVRFQAGKAEKLLPFIYENEGVKADVIVVDPPRKGCDEAAIDTMIRMSPARIVYMSCDPATLARDIARLKKGGYEPQKVCVFDNFCQSTHVETIALLARIKDTMRV